MKLKLLFVLAALALIACGEDTETLRVTDRYTLDLLGKGVSLTEEKCDSARTGQLLYVSDSTGIFYCTGKVWKKVNGEDGKVYKHIKSPLPYPAGYQAGSAGALSLRKTSRF